MDEMGQGRRHKHIHRHRDIYANRFGLSALYVAVVGEELVISPTLKTYFPYNPASRAVSWAMRQPSGNSCRPTVNTVGYETRI